MLFKTKHKPYDTELRLKLCRNILNKTITLSDTLE